MAKTDTSERWFEARVVRGLTGVPQPEYSHALAPTDFAATHNGYVQGKPTDYNRDVALDVAQLLAFLQATQPKALDTLELAADGIKRTQFLHRIGFIHRQHISLFYDFFIKKSQSFRKQKYDNQQNSNARYKTAASQYSFYNLFPNSFHTVLVFYFNN